MGDCESPLMLFCGLFFFGRIQYCPLLTCPLVVTHVSLFNHSYTVTPWDMVFSQTAMDSFSSWFSVFIRARLSSHPLLSMSSNFKSNSRVYIKEMDDMYCTLITIYPFPLFLNSLKLVYLLFAQCASLRIRSYHLLGMYKRDESIRIAHGAEHWPESNLDSYRARIYDSCSEFWSQASVLGNGTVCQLHGDETEGGHSRKHLLAASWRLFETILTDTGNPTLFRFHWCYRLLLL